MEADLLATLRIWILFIAACFLTAPSMADDCAPSAAHDRCLVGNWKMTVNGAEEWMRHNLHMAHAISVQATNNTIAFKPDGTFLTGASHVTTHVASNNGHTEGSGTLSAQASGRWATRDGALYMCTAAVNSSGTVHLQDSSGANTTMAMPHMTAQNSHQAYHCSGDTFTTSTPMPHGSTATSTYVRIH